MGTREDETARLRALHDEAVWQVNAAVAEGRYDLVASLTDDYVDAALQHDGLPGGRGTHRPPQPRDTRRADERRQLLQPCARPRQLGGVGPQRLLQRVRRRRGGRGAGPVRPAEARDGTDRVVGGGSHAPSSECSMLGSRTAGKGW